MKNFIPLILSVLLGLAAVLAVGRLLAARKQAAEKTTSVVAAARDIEVGNRVTADMIMKKEVPVSARPANAIYWSRSEMVVGQKALRSIVQGDYLFLTDVGMSRSMANIVGEGEWAVAMMLPPTGVARIVQPGDEVAVIGTFKIQTQVETADLSAPAEEITKEATIVLFPRVRVLDVGGQTGAAGRGDAGSEIIVALPPQQAQFLVAAQRQARLTLALRSPNDDTMQDRLDAGMVDAQTFNALLKGLKPVELPAVPGTGVMVEE